MTVHVYGEVELQEDEHELISVLHDMLSKYEAPEKFIQFARCRCWVSRWYEQRSSRMQNKKQQNEGKAKFSQNHPLQRQKLNVNQLEQISNTNEQQISLIMKSNLKK